jgi:hypothetical protein
MGLDLRQRSGPLPEPRRFFSSAPSIAGAGTDRHRRQSAMLTLLGSPAGAAALALRPIVINAVR